MMTFKIPEQYYLILQEISRREGRSMGEIIREALTFYFRMFYKEIAQDILPTVVKHEKLRGVGLILYVCSSCGSIIRAEPAANFAPAKTTRVVYEYRQCPICGKQLSVNSNRLVFIPTGEVKFRTVREV